MADIDLGILRHELDKRHVAVFDAESGAWRPIPIALTPTTATISTWRRLEHDARLIVRAFPKVMRFVRSGVDRGLSKQICAGLTPFELNLLNASSSEFHNVTIRMDLCWHQDAWKVVEVNCTIPAMQAYSDNVLSAWCTAGGFCNSDINPSNQRQLLSSLILEYRRCGGSVSKPAIAILHRPGDSQIGELQSLEKLWNQCGFYTRCVTATEVSSKGDLWLANGDPFEIIYRHLFASKMHQFDSWTSLISQSEPYVFNQFSGHYETKAFLAIVSEICDDRALAQQVGLSDDEINAVTTLVPWTRVVSHESKIHQWYRFEENLDGFVIKRSVGYGGHQVFLGSDWYSNTTQELLEKETGLNPLIKPLEFIDWVRKFDTNNVWILQERLSGIRRQTPVLVGDKLEWWNAWYDASIFLNSGEPICNGGVSRISKNPIVNIGRGGGMAPFVIEN